MTNTANIPKPNSNLAPPIRIGELDGLRGWASLSVAFAHIVYQTLEGQWPGFRNILTASLFNGEFAVMIFFVLSGDALSTPFWKSNSQLSVLSRLALKRYPRLTVPILAACLLQTLLLLAHLSASQQAGALLNINHLIAAPTTPDQLSQFLYYTLVGVYIAPLDHPVIPYLWTMRSEMLGSIFVFCFLVVSRWVSFPKIIAGAICALLLWYDALISCFFFGILLAKLRNENVFAAPASHKIINTLAILGFIACVVLSGYLNLTGSQSRTYYMALSMVLCLSVALSDTLKSLLSAPLSAFLGRISFPLYLTHYPVLICVFSNLVVMTQANWSGTPAILLLISLISMATAIGLAMLFQPVDRLSMWIGDCLCRILLPKRPPSPKR